jgi:alkanesulfonate monooxygenase
MTVELIGWVDSQESSEIIDPRGPAFDPEAIARAARTHEEAGFDRVLIGYFSWAADGFLVGAHAASVTDGLGLLLAHRPGFVSPTLAARKLATLDQLTGGRTAVHIIAGGTTADQARDGDHVDHGTRYRRAAEYIEVLRATWSNESPFDHVGEFYDIRGSVSHVKPVNGHSLPVYGGGGSDAAVDRLAPHLDTFMLWGEPLADTAAFMDLVRRAAAPRSPGFSVSTRPILGATDGEAWDRARRILAEIQRRRPQPPGRPENVGSQRLLDAAARNEVFDRCLWTPLATATGAPGNSTALVGTAETVAEALADYHDLGATSLLIRGYEPLADAAEYGRELIPRTRALIDARRQARIAVPRT